ncbi:hypothetical protein L345_15818, partial [Ophiophagus hannah]
MTCHITVIYHHLFQHQSKDRKAVEFSKILHQARQYERNENGEKDETRRKNFQFSNTNKEADEEKESLAKLNSSRLLGETDSPQLTPQPVQQLPFTKHLLYTTVHLPQLTWRHLHIHLHPCTLFLNHVVPLV